MECNNNTKSSLSDTMGLIPYKIDIHMTTELFPYQLTVLFNSFLISSFTSKALKFARIVTIPKATNLKPHNFLRPISIHHILLKTLEKCKVKITTGFFENENILSPIHTNLILEVTILLYMHL